MSNLKIHSRSSGTQPGFTIVELLIVVVVIAILATITIVSYNGIITRAHQSKLISEVASAGLLMSTEQSASGIYPLSRTAVNNGKGLNNDADVSYSFYSSQTTFCITGTSSHVGVNKYYVSEKNLSPLEGSCAQDLGAQVATFAGSGAAGWADGTGTAAILMSPVGLVSDPTGNLYFTDTASSRIRMVTPAGVVTTVGGGAGSGYIDGVAGTSRYNSPQAVTIGATNVLYVADTQNSKIRMINRSTTVTSPFVGGAQGDKEGTGTGALFNTPRGIVYDPIRNMVIVADSQSHRIRQVTMAGEMTTLAGQQASGGTADAQGVNAKFNYPQGLTIDSAGIIYVADTLNHAIRKIDQAGNVTTLAGGGTGFNGVNGYVDATGTAARFNSPMAVAVDGSGNVFVADSANNRIRKITTAGVVTTIAGNGTAGYQDGIGKADTMFSAPRGIAIGSDGRLYVTDMNNNRIRVITNYNI